MVRYDVNGACVWREGGSGDDVWGVLVTSCGLYGCWEVFHPPSSSVRESLCYCRQVSPGGCGQSPPTPLTRMSVNHQMPNMGRRTEYIERRIQWNLSNLNTSEKCL